MNGKMPAILEERKLSARCEPIGNQKRDERNA
jgi:hypothetical protein